MKKFIAITAFTLVSLTANATLSTTCKKDLDNVITNKIFIQNGIESGEITQERGDLFLDMSENAAESVALMCAGLKQIELERGLAGKLGLISYEKAVRIGDKTYQEAIEYYKSASSSL